MTSLSKALGGQKKEQLFGVGSASLAGVRSGQLFIYSTENAFLCAQCLVSAGGPVGNMRGAGPEPHVADGSGMGQTFSLSCK